MALPGIAGSTVAGDTVAGAGDSITSVSSFHDDPSKRIRKPYTITKSRESWTEQDHDRFLEALQLFDRDWKKIEAFIGSKTVIQMNRHQQNLLRPQCLILGAIAVSRDHPITESELAKEELGLRGATVVGNCTCCSTESPCGTRQFSEITDQGDHLQLFHVMPDFEQAYSFLGSIFDPSTSGHLQKLKEMNPMDLEAVLLLMKNLATNLVSSDFESSKLLLASCDGDGDATEIKSVAINGPFLVDEVVNSPFMVKSA